MATAFTGVFPCFKNTVRVGATKETATEVAELIDASVEIEYTTDEWQTHKNKGFTSRMKFVTGAKATITGKRSVGDVGNDFIAGKVLATGRDAEGYFAVDIPTGETIEMPNAVFGVKNFGTGEATKVAPLEAEILSNGEVIASETAASEDTE